MQNKSIITISQKQNNYKAIIVLLQKFNKLEPTEFISGNTFIEWSLVLRIVRTTTSSEKIKGLRALSNCVSQRATRVSLKTRRIY